MKKTLFLVFVSILMIFSMPVNSKANFKVPISKESDQWRVELQGPSDDKKGEQGRFELYNLIVTNKEEKVHNVTVEVFRNEINSNKMYGLAPVNAKLKLTLFAH